jgi:hypothetical protein
MKKQSENRFPAINAEETKNLTTVVKETLATVKPRIFGAVNMWDLQRRGRTMMQRRNYFA